MHPTDLPLCFIAEGELGRYAALMSLTFELISITLK